MVNEGAERPALTTEEADLLRGLAPDTETVRGVLDDLEEIGVNVDSARTQLDATERMRVGMLDKFPAKRQRRRAQ
jgi:hypothetical protein